MAERDFICLELSRQAREGICSEAVLCDLGVNSPPLHQGRCQPTGATSLLHGVACTVRWMISLVTVMLAQFTLSDELALSSAPEKLLLHVPPVIHPEPFVGLGHASRSLNFVFHHPLPFPHLAVTQYLQLSPKVHQTLVTEKRS